MLKLCICDDQPGDLERLEGFTAEFFQSRPDLPALVETFRSPFDLLERLEEKGGFDIYLLDILMPHLSGLELARKLRERVGACLARTHAEGLMDKRVGALSGGELQRVLMALALEPLPHILILDEPLSGVDRGGEHLLMEMLDEIRQKYDLSILFSTHDFSTLRLYADKVILLQQEILTTGTPSQVLRSPEFQAVFHLDLEEEGGDGL